MKYGFCAYEMLEKASLSSWLFLMLCNVQQLQNLVQEADPGADYRIDRALNEACESVIQTACKHIRNGDPM